MSRHIASRRTAPIRPPAARILRAWLDYMSNRVPRHLREMGYVRELRALRARRDRCRSAWRPHLEHTRAVIQDAVARCEQRRSALVVGSGLLFDIPLEELSRHFERVVLVDIVHAWSVHRAATRFSNVRLLPLDVTGVVERCHSLARGRAPARLPQHQVDRLAGERFDLVASVNILSQLPVVPNGYMSRRIRSLGEARTREFSRALVTNHLDWLCSFPGVVCLVTDLERLCYGDCGLVSREESLWGVALPEGGRDWLWDLAPRPEMYFHLDVRHRVGGYASFPKRAWLDARNRAAARRVLPDSAVSTEAGVPAGVAQTVSSPISRE